MELMKYLHSHDYGVTSFDSEDATAKDRMIFTIIKRQDLLHVAGIIKQFLPNAFHSVNEKKSVAEGMFTERRS